MLPSFRGPWYTTDHGISAQDPVVQCRNSVESPVTMSLHSHASKSTAVRALAPADRIAALADPGSVGPVDASFEAARASPHLARWGINARDDDGVVIARATIGGARVLFAAQDNRFLGGSAGANHADALRRLFEVARAERPACVVLLAASGGVRLHEANAAEWALARALAALLELRISGVPVLTVGVGDVFGGTSVLACAAERIALVSGVRLGLSGPAVIEMAKGRSEFDATDAAAIAAVFGAAARATAGQVDELPDSADAIRRYIVRFLGEPSPFGTWVETTQERLAARLEKAPEAMVLPPLPQNLAPLYEDARPGEREGWLRRIGVATSLCRPIGAGTFGPSEAHSLDAALLEDFASIEVPYDRMLVLLDDSSGHEVSRQAEALCVSQFLAQHAAVLAWLRSRGVRLRGVLTGLGHSAEFFSHVLQAPEATALAGARVVAMDPAAIARVTRLPERELAAMIENDSLLGHPVRHFAHWAGWGELLPDDDTDRLRAFVLNPQRTARDPR